MEHTNHLFLTSTTGVVHGNGLSPTHGGERSPPVASVAAPAPAEKSNLGPKRSRTDPATYTGSSENQVHAHDRGVPREGEVQGKYAQGKIVQSPTLAQSSTFGTRSQGHQANGMASISECDKHTAEIRRQQERIDRLKGELRMERLHSKQLQSEITEQAHVINNIHSNNISRLSHGVSSNLPDDRIRAELQKLFGETARDWCLNYQVAEIAERGVDALLVCNNILADNANINMQGKTTAPILLQAALAKTLCELFLTKPFFLQDWVSEFIDGAIKEPAREATITWRVQTGEFLEMAFSHSEAHLEAILNKRAQRFARQYAFLLCVQDFDENMCSELVELMKRFGKLAIQLWRRRVLIMVDGLEHEDLQHFRPGQDMELEDSLRRLGGLRSDGRPVQVIVRPRITAQMVHLGGKLAEKVVWSKAVVWVSDA
ncbi:hypothetical protein CEP54_003637 [Fusarium duplospermum]|uniref:Uncharacterized protein n=1 Tax=Fusarium duplospermum TaxID=1325734 RepID=A0A428QMW0_9HYPO|nr:hypothetical protein CEP54_003637 [Fusarium duplospermum]